MAVEIREASPVDVEQLKSIFMGNLQTNPSYISHGEVQMGVGELRFEEGDLHGYIAPNGFDMWEKYIREKIEGNDAVVYIAESDGRVAGFCVADIEEDGADPFGMVCDVLVLPESRGGGVGSMLLDVAISWLRSKGIKDIYLESGKDNHAAHEYFERRGFYHVSNIYKLG
ncbi:MAG: GNAT family N-acetyltransferase [Marinifilaceae bacterium]|nr:GNAT family N-acetyltransferase [Marinifilaceae bacterium]